MRWRSAVWGTVVAVVVLSAAPPGVWAAPPESAPSPGEAPAVPEGPTPAPAPQGMSPEEHARMLEVNAERKKADRLILAGGIVGGVGVLAEIGLLIPFFWLASRIGYEAEEGERVPDFGTWFIAQGAAGGALIVAGGTLVLVGVVRRKSAPRRVDERHLSFGPGGARLHF